jgi:hypothetical protein
MRSDEITAAGAFDPYFAVSALTAPLKRGGVFGGGDYEEFQLRRAEDIMNI